MDNETREILNKLLEGQKNMQEQQKAMQEQQKEDHLILRALEHSAEEVNKTEHDKIFSDIAHMERHMKNIDENIDAIKGILGRHEVDITVLKRRPV